ncbi:MAG TPA: hypothetical protein VLE73_01360 [Candidatus Saccharimonadales bacterium]|nr:hypothetical protein [Candidatus Saccharimonadales bacterium]
METHPRHTGIPEPIADAVLSGNLYYPTIISGIAVFGSAAATDMLVHKKTTIPELAWMAPTEAQLQRTAAALNRAHAAFGVAFRTEGTPNPNPQQAMPIVPKIAVRAASLQWRASLFRAAADFAHDTCPGIPTVPAESPLNISPKTAPNYEELTAIRYEAACHLFHNPQQPAALAFHGICTALYKTMDPRQNELACQLTRERLAHVKARMLADSESEAGMAAYRAERVVNTKITNMGGQAARDALPMVYEQTGVLLPLAAADHIATAMFGRAVRSQTLTQPEGE